MFRIRYECGVKHGPWRIKVFLKAGAADTPEEHLALLDTGVSRSTVPHKYVAAKNAHFVGVEEPFPRGGQRAVEQDTYAVIVTLGTYYKWLNVFTHQDDTVILGRDFLQDWTIVACNDRACGLIGIPADPSRRCFSDPWAAIGCVDKAHLRLVI